MLGVVSTRMSTFTRWPFCAGVANWVVHFGSTVILSTTNFTEMSELLTPHPAVSPICLMRFPRADSFASAAGIALAGAGAAAAVVGTFTVGDEGERFEHAVSATAATAGATTMRTVGRTWTSRSRSDLPLPHRKIRYARYGPRPGRTQS